VATASLIIEDEENGCHGELAEYRRERAKGRIQTAGFSAPQDDEAVLLRSK
jgi:hypothetical protein